jgi:heptaprenyl diphosphate synthase/octaprenyl-diphosphate synthase
MGARYFRKVTVPISALPAVQEELELVDAEVHRLALGSSELGMDTAVAQLLATGGKRMRSVLLLLTHRAFGGVPDGTEITAAAAVEMVHAGSLAHDDLMDAATERRGVRTVNADYGTSMAVMVGDRLLARAGQAALAVSPQVASELIQSLVELIEGQVMEMTDAYDLGRTEERARRSISLKTGTLFRSGCVIGALAAGVTEGEELELARRFGDRFGDAFQILDDLLDLVSTTELLGKPVGNDLRQGTYTVPLLRALRLPELGWIRDLLGGSDRRDLAEGTVEKVLAALKQGPFVDETMAYVRSLAAGAAAVLDEPVAGGRDWAVLRELPLDYVTWAESLISR